MVFLPLTTRKEMRIKGKTNLIGAERLFKPLHDSLVRSKKRASRWCIRCDRDLLSLSKRLDWKNYLLSTGVPWNALSPSDLSACDVAMEHGHREAFDDLLNAGVQAELVLGTVARAERKGDGGGSSYLEDRVSFSEDKVMDSESKAVMMTRERPLMEAHAKAICGGGGGGRVLNVGFGMGIVDEATQRYGPVEHNIMEAHPDVYERMLRCGRRRGECQDCFWPMTGRSSLARIL